MQCSWACSTMGAFCEKMGDGLRCTAVLTEAILMLANLMQTRCRPKRDVTPLARRTVSAARTPSRPAAGQPNRRQRSYAAFPRARRPAGPHAGSVTDDDRRQLAKQYWPITRASNKHLNSICQDGAGLWWHRRNNRPINWRVIGLNDFHLVALPERKVIFM